MGLSPVECSELIRWHASYESTHALSLSINSENQIVCSPEKLRIEDIARCLRSTSFFSILRNRYVETCQTDPGNILLPAIQKVMAIWNSFLSPDTSLLTNAEILDCAKKAIQQNSFPEIQFWFVTHRPDVLKQPSAAPQLCSMVSEIPHIQRDFLEMIFPKVLCQHADLKEPIRSQNHTVYDYLLSQGLFPTFDLLNDAASVKDPYFIKNLIEAQELHRTPHTDKNPLFTALSKGHCDIALYLKTHGFTISEEEKQELLIEYSRIGDLTSIQMLINIFKAIPQPVHLEIAAQAGHLPVVEFLLDRNTPILPSTLYRSADRVFPLLATKWKTLPITQHAKNEYLALSIFHSHEQACLLFLEQGAEIETPHTLVEWNFATYTPLMIAARYAPQLISLLLERGANPLAIQPCGSILHIAFKNENLCIQTIQILTSSLTEETLQKLATLEDSYGHTGLDKMISYLCKQPPERFVAIYRPYLRYFHPSWES